MLGDQQVLVGYCGQVLHVCEKVASYPRSLPYFSHGKSHTRHGCAGHITCQNKVHGLDNQGKALFGVPGPGAYHSPIDWG